MSGPRVVSDETATLSQAHIPKDSWLYAHEDAQVKKKPRGMRGLSIFSFRLILTCPYFGDMQTVVKHLALGAG